MVCVWGNVQSEESLTNKDDLWWVVLWKKDPMWLDNQQNGLRQIYFSQVASRLNEDEFVLAVKVSNCYPASWHIQMLGGIGLFWNWPFGPVRSWIITSLPLKGPWRKARWGRFSGQGIFLLDDENVSPETAAITRDLVDLYLLAPFRSSTRIWRLNETDVHAESEQSRFDCSRMLIFVPTLFGGLIFPNTIMSSRKRRLSRSSDRKTLCLFSLPYFHMNAALLSDIFSTSFCSRKNICLAHEGNLHFIWMWSLKYIVTENFHLFLPASDQDNDHGWVHVNL